MTTLVINVANAEFYADLEARIALADMLSRVLVARAAKDRPMPNMGGVGASGGESMAAQGFRLSVGAMFSAKLRRDMAAEETSAMADYAQIEALSGADLDAYGSGTWGLARGTDAQGNSWSDATYRTNLHALADLEERPLRKAIREAADTAVDGLLASGEIRDLVDSVIASLGGSV